MITHEQLATTLTAIAEKGDGTVSVTALDLAAITARYAARAAHLQAVAIIKTADLSVLSRRVQDRIEDAFAIHGFKIVRIGCTTRVSSTWAVVAA